MIRKITFLAFFLASVLSFAQGPVGHLTIFSEDGDKFTLILNGETINDTPQTNLRVEDLNQPYYNAKIRFADQTLTDISKNNLMLTDVDGVFNDVTYKIKRDKNNKTKMKLNFFSAIPVQPNFIPAANVHVIHYGQPGPGPAPSVGQTTTTTTTTTTQGTGATMGVGMNVGGVNMGITINDNMGGGAVTQTTTTSTHTTSTGGVHHQEAPRGCAGNSCISAGNFNAALATINKQSFDDSKLKTAKQVVSANCLNVDQIMQIATSFSFEENTLAFAKFAYDYCVNPGSYFKLNGIFKFSSNADDLSDYVQSRQ